MNLKAILGKIIPPVLGIAIGIGGTLGAQALFFPKTTTTQVVVQGNGPVVQIGEFTVNLQGGSFLKTQIAVEGAGKKSDVEIEAKKDFIKDRINTVLSSKSLKDMQPQNREQLKKELISQLNEVTGNKVKDILFLTFIYQ
ncbi:flagellar basal body-associated FliL family protein [Desulfitobacterium sp.]|uniref:flagellar basal body-associated FliL family protein n=1 Tax=Desulfitobacterium sp. TaxID=49981 RepID=UPI002B1F22CA|nr:flagellar basal body-associated FliL family protein [Desulfitobacterium sp.]MEA4900842.1 flagellar basal body-associated FliL family protein [Desulfitobacterium sp.]